MSDPILNPDTETAALRVVDPVRKLTEDIADALVEAVRDALEGAGGDVHAVPIIETRLRAFLAEQEGGWLAVAIEDARHRSTEIPPWAKSANGPQQDAEQAGALAALRGALEQVGDLVAAEDVSWEVVGLQAENIIRAALASEAGRAEAEVIALVRKYHETAPHSMVERNDFINALYRLGDEAWGFPPEGLPAARGEEG